MESMIGKRVMFTREGLHESYSEWYPPVGTIGRIVNASKDGFEGFSFLVQWPSYSGVRKYGYEKSATPYAWYCSDTEVELLDEPNISSRNSNEMADEEIWNMLEPKMTKNGFNPVDRPYCRYYDADMVHEMIALAYRCAYARGKKGKPFEYQKKNKEENNIED